MLSVSITFGKSVKLTHRTFHVLRPWTLTNESGEGLRQAGVVENEISAGLFYNFYHLSYFQLNTISGNC